MAEHTHRQKDLLWRGPAWGVQGVSPLALLGLLDRSRQRPPMAGNASPQASTQPARTTPEGQGVRGQKPEYPAAPKLGRGTDLQHLLIRTSPAAAYPPPYPPAYFPSS